MVSPRRTQAIVALFVSFAVALWLSLEPQPSRTPMRSSVPLVKEIANITVGVADSAVFLHDGASTEAIIVTNEPPVRPTELRGPISSTLPRSWTVASEPRVTMRNLLWPPREAPARPLGRKLYVALTAAGRLGVASQFLSQLSYTGFFHADTHFDTYLALSVSRMVTTTTAMFYQDMMTVRGNRLLLFDYIERLLTPAQKERRARMIQKQLELSRKYGPVFNTVFEFAPDGVAQFTHKWLVNQYRKSLALNYDVVIRTRTDTILLQDFGEPRDLHAKSVEFLQRVNEYVVTKHMYFCTPDYFAVGTPEVIDIEAEYGMNDEYPMAFMLDYMLNIMPHRHPDEFYRLGWESKNRTDYISGTMFTPVNVERWMVWKNVSVARFDSVHLDRKGAKYVVWALRDYKPSRLDHLLLAPELWQQANSTAQVASNAVQSCRMMNRVANATVWARWDAAVGNSLQDTRHRFPLGPEVETTATVQYFRHIEWGHNRLSVEVVSEPLGMPMLAHHSFCDACAGELSGALGNVSAECRLASEKPMPFFVSEGTVLSVCESVMQGAWTHLAVAGQYESPPVSRLSQVLADQDCPLSRGHVADVPPGTNGDAVAQAAADFVRAIPRQQRIHVVVALVSESLEFNVHVAEQMAKDAGDDSPKLVLLRLPTAAGVLFAANEADRIAQWNLVARGVAAAKLLREKCAEVRIIH